jgi:hypothetical protein
MPVEAKEPQVQSPEIDFNNYSVLHGLRLVLHDLDSRKREEMLEMTDEFELPPFVAPEGYGIEIKPNYAKSREVPLVVKAFDKRFAGWLQLNPASDKYKKLVRAPRYAPHFVGHSIEQEAVDGETYVYSTDRQSRVQVTNETLFSLVEKRPA